MQRNVKLLLVGLVALLAALGIATVVLGSLPDVENLIILYGECGAYAQKAIIAYQPLLAFICKIFLGLPSTILIK